MECICNSMSMMELLTQEHLMELQQQWQNYERELEDCQKYITSVVAPFLQSVTDNIAGKDIDTQRQTAQVIFASLYMFVVWEILSCYLYSRHVLCLQLADN